MNICLLIGKICSEIKFEFILNSKEISIVMFDIELLNGSIVKVKGYNEIADYCYSNLKKEMTILIEGSVDYNMTIILEEIEIIDKKKNYLEGVE